MTIPAQHPESTSSEAGLSPRDVRGVADLEIRIESLDAWIASWPRLPPGRRASDASADGRVARADGLVPLA